MSDKDVDLVMDASTIINLNATGCSGDILRALPNRVVVVDIVFEELKNGLQKGRNDAHKLTALTAEDHVEIVTLREVGWSYFESLVFGSANETLDDGEAATIAYAVESNSQAVIDERKAIRIGGRRFPNLNLGCTVDLFRHIDVQRALGQERLAYAVLNALHQARMRVLQHHVDWIVNLIGVERAADCLSLPYAVRNRGAMENLQDRSRTN